MSYRETEIKNLKDSIKLLESIKVECDSMNEKNYSAFDYLHDFKPGEIETKIAFQKAALSVLEYFNEKVKGEDCLKLGKYIGVNLSFYWDNLHLGLYLEDRETESKLYDYVFGSHSGINEFVQEHFPDVFSIVLGDTGYSHAFGSYDIKHALNSFKYFGYHDSEKKSYCWDEKEFKKHVERSKAIIDYFFELSQNKELMEDLDKVLSVYFEVVFKYNKEN